MKILLKDISLIFIILLSFVTNANSQKADKSNVGGLLFFPIQLPDLKEDVNDKMRNFRNKWYSKHLASMNEPVLYDKIDMGLKVFRYTNLGTNSNPFVIRVELIDSIVNFSYRISDGKGGYGTGKLIKEIQIQLPVSDWNKILDKVESTKFWDLHSYRSFDSNGNRMVILDGTEWIFEGLIGEKYHFVTRNTPESYYDKDYASLCNLLYDYFLVIDNEATRKNDPHLVNFKLKI